MMSCSQGVRETGAAQQNLTFCERGRWHERCTIETDLSWVTERFNAKQLYHRVTEHLVAHLRYLVALLYCLLDIAGGERSFARYPS